MGKLTIRYEGYWQCRQATDPDPSGDPRGASGYVFATGRENDLDQIIRLQRDEIEDCDFRTVPEERSSTRFGVFVRAVECDGRPWAPGQALVGGPVRWLPAGKKDEGPRFEMRNTITFHPNTRGIFIPIIPFCIQITDPAGEIELRRSDPLDPENPGREIWEIADLDVYKRRCPVRFVGCSDEVMEAIGLQIPDSVAPQVQSGIHPDPRATLQQEDWGDPSGAFNDYFQRRKEWLELAILEAQHRRDHVEREALRMRLFALTFTDAFEDRLGLQAIWDHDVVGNDAVVRGAEKLGSAISVDEPWHVHYWMGGFDGDLARGYLRGTLEVPFAPAS